MNNSSRIMSGDPAYAHEFGELEQLCAKFLEHRDEMKASGTLDPDPGSLLLCGMLVGQLAKIYKLDSPAGLVNIAKMFEREAEGHDE